MPNALLSHHANALLWMSSPQHVAVSCKCFQTSRKQGKPVTRTKNGQKSASQVLQRFYHLHRVYSSNLLNLWHIWFCTAYIYSRMRARSTSDSHIWCHFQMPSWPAAPVHPQLFRHHQGPSWPSKCRCRSGWSWGRLPLLRQTRLHPTSALLSTASSNTSTPNIHMPAHASSHSNTWTPTHLHTEDHHIQTLQHPTSTQLHTEDHHIQTLQHPHSCTQKITTFKHFNTQHPHSCTQKITTFKHFNTQHPHIENQSPHSNISTPNTCTQKITFKCFNTQQPHTCTQTTTFKPFNTHTPAHRPPHSNTWTPTHLHTKDHIQTLQHPTATHLHTDHHIQTLQQPHTCTQATTFKHLNTQQPHTCTLVSMWGGAGGGHMRCHSGREHAEKGFRKNKDQSWKKGGPWSVIHFIWKYITKERLHCIFINGTTVFSSQVPLYFLLKVLLYVCQRHHCIFITKAAVFSSKVLLSFHQRCYCIFIKDTTVFFIKGATILSSKVPLFIKCATVFLPKGPQFIKCATVFSSMVPLYFRMHPSQY